jgi:hypothetical protein
MLNNILLAAAVTIPGVPLCAPILAENINPPRPIPVVAAPGVNAFVGGLGQTGSMPPTMALYEKQVNNNIACRNAARSKYFELGAKDLSQSDSNSQWATVGNMKVVAWCRENRVVISVAGYNYDSVVELRDEVIKAF